MDLAVGRLMEWRKNLLKNGRLEDLARQYLFPMAIYADGDTRPITSPAELMEVFRAFTASLSVGELAHLESRVTAIELPKDGRFRVWSEWQVNRPGHPSRMIGKTTHFMRETPQGPMTEMLECIHPASESSAIRQSG